MTEVKTMVNDLTEGNVLKKLITFALPFMLANVIQTLYGVIDMVVVGNSEIGSVGLSAISVGSLLTQLFTNFVMGFTSGGQVVLSQLVGAKNNKALNKTIGNLFTLTILFGLFFGAVGLIFSNQLLNLVNTPAAALGQTKQYFTICCIGLVFMFGYNAVSAVLRGMGDSKRPLIFIFISCIVNIILDLLLVSVFNMESAGAAIATIISQATSFIIAIIYLRKRKETFGFDFKMSSFALEKETAMTLLKVGFPQGFQQSTVILSFMYVNSQVNNYGTVASAVSGVGLKICSILGVVTNGLSAAASNMIGQNFAVGNIERVKKTANTTIIISVCYTCLFSIFALFNPEFLFGLFNKEAAVLEMSHQYMPYGVVAFFAFATMVITCVCHGVGDSTTSMLIGLMDGIVARIGLSMFFGNRIGLPGYWLGNGAAGYASAILGGLYYISGVWKKRKPVIKTN